MKRYILSSLAVMLISTVVSATVYEEGEGAENWKMLDALPAKAISVYDKERKSKVIEFQGDGFRSAYIYGYGATAWNNNAERVLQWSMKYNQDYAVYVRVMTTKGFRFIMFTPNGTEGKKEVYIQHVLGEDSKNGAWQDFRVDLEEELKEYEPDNSIVSVNGIIFRGSGRVDDIKLLDGNYAENIPPTADAGEDKSVALGDSVTITGTATDSDGMIVSYEWKEGNNVLATTASFDYTLASAGTHTLTFTVVDDDGATATDEMNVTQANTNSSSEGLSGTYYGVNHSLSNIAQFRNIIENHQAVEQETFIATNLDYGYGVGTVSLGNNLQQYFLKHDASSLSGDPDDTGTGGINLLGQIYLEAGVYNFKVHSDDGYQIKIDGVSVAEVNHNQSPTTRVHSPFTIEDSGYHDIDIIWWDQGAEYVFKVELSNDNGETYNVVTSDILSH